MPNSYNLDGSRRGEVAAAPVSESKAYRMGVRLPEGVTWDMVDADEMVVQRRTNLDRARVHLATLPPTVMAALVQIEHMIDPNPHLGDNQRQHRLRMAVRDRHSKAIRLLVAAHRDECQLAAYRIDDALKARKQEAA